MDFDALLTNGIFCALFIWYLTKNEEKQEKRYENQRADYKEDKKQMYEQLEKNNAVLTEQGKSLERITSTLDSMNSEIAELKEEIRKE